MLLHSNLHGLYERRMLALDDGTRIELFNYVTDRPRPPARTCDIGYQHMAVLVDSLPEV
ncbi:hypothetical protein MAF45_10090 [Mesosutterella sp. OilRF-GAM-744-9]|uniref:Uncharacterized protein n=1 Tax=Mesosutterella porci TaxID=2915351 RepID=A0ABS9MU48_9BURK|nr:hypothetical protein [Mesosutterella sp. oilRF-744-WT-GAM-9]MCG5031785.1 hypothetical protein [Mesosutterella sp. oilRF-744-WT-GAM-9]